MATGFVSRTKGKIASALDLITDLRMPAGTGVTAHAGGGQASATPLSATGINVVSTVTTAADSVLLPPSAVGKIVPVLNVAANSMQVFGTGTDTVNGAAFATGAAHAGHTGFFYICYAAGAWQSA